jgi:mitogen-activated protein kinase 15
MLDFMENLLYFDPFTRFSAESALAHSWLSDFHNPRDEPLYEGSNIAHALSDNKKLSINQYQKELESMSSQ